MQAQDPTVSELLTHQFYEWEQLGRGRLVYTAHTVDLEPPFHPFFFHTVKPLRYVDDSRIPSFFDELRTMFKDKDEEVPKGGLYEPLEIEPVLFECDEPLRVLSVYLPKGYKVSIAETEQLLLILSSARYPLSFEIIGRKVRITLQVTCRESDTVQVKSTFQSYFPGCIVKDRENDLIMEIATNENYKALFDLSMQEEFMRPLAMAPNFNLDPFIGLFASLDHVEEDEYVVFQILFKGTVNPWTESILRSVTGNEGKGFFVNAPEMVGLAKEKVSSPLVASVIRVLTSSPTLARAKLLAEVTGKAFVRIYTTDFNTLCMITNTGIEFETLLHDIAFRETHRFGMLVNVRELATAVHLPSDSVTTSKLERDTRKTKQAPEMTKGHELVLGINEHQGKESEVTVSAVQRLKHTHIIGATGTGKSTLLLNLIIQDILHYNGFCVLDPHGDLIDSIISYIPDYRSDDVVIIDPSDSEYPVGFNFLTAHTEIEKDILASDLVAVFRRLSASWGDQMNSVFANAILAFVESSKGGTLVDLRKFLVEKSFRDTFLKTVTDPNIVYYWQKEYPLLKSGSIGSILTRLDTFLRPKLIRNMVAQKQSLDFGHLMDTNKIILVKLSQGLIGAENSYLLGTVIVSKIQQAAMARQAKEKEARSDFFLYIDEFQNFITNSMQSILSGARKYHLGLILAHQDMAQLIKQDSELASSVMSNAGTRICFRVGDTDAKRFADGFSFFEAKDLQNLNVGEAIARVERSENDFSLTTEPLLETIVPEYVGPEIIDNSRQWYATPRHEVEEQFIQEGQQVATEAPLEKESEKKYTAKRETPIPEPPIQEPPPSAQETPDETTKQLKRQKELSDHRFLQTLIKRMAEERGYKATIEDPTPDGKGRVDVSLERNSKRIAVEVCMTTEAEWELHNIEKCFKAGYGIVVECSNDMATLERIRKKVESSIDKAVLSRILIVEPKSLFEYLDQELAKENATNEVRIKGYRVKPNYANQSPESMLQKKESLARLLMDAEKKKKR